MFSLSLAPARPWLGAERDPVLTISAAAAAEMERVLRERDPLVVAVGSERLPRVSSRQFIQAALKRTATGPNLPGMRRSAVIHCGGFTGRFQAKAKFV